MHEQWEDLIPFYVAQSLAPFEVIALERHLNTCALCQTSVREWSYLATAVREQATLSAAVRRYVSKMAAPAIKEEAVYQTADSLPIHVPVRRPQPMRLTL